GRIARDGKVGYCYLLSNSEDEEVISRLTFIATCNDGFKISEYDLKRRGAGDLLGIQQSGKSPFYIANLIDDFNILKAASNDASFIFANEEKYENIINTNKKVLEKAMTYID
ncbi:MAG: ATP-dependent DNA helicase RecG, partial [Erysipelotrichaceae bacterium]|nr:ATP-dependent DNA helicase RecG [Erysipelotrichaceae bacterium]